MKVLFYSGCVLAVALNGAVASSLFVSDFNMPTYSDGPLVGQDGWATHSGTGSAVQVSNTGVDGVITLAQGSGSREDVNHGLGSIMGAGNTWYAGFDVKVSGGGDSTESYIAHFKDAGATSGFVGRIFVTTPNAMGGDFTFGLSQTGSVETTYLTDYDYDTVYRAVVSYDFDSGQSQLWIDPVNMASPSLMTTVADVGEDIQTFAFRQGAGNTTQVIDNLSVATTFVEAIPEPSAVLLCFVGAGAWMAKRRRASSARRSR